METSSSGDEAPADASAAEAALAQQAAEAALAQQAAEAALEQQVAAALEQQDAEFYALMQNAKNRLQTAYDSDLDNPAFANFAIDNILGKSGVPISENMDYVGKILGLNLRVIPTNAQGQREMIQNFSRENQKVLFESFIDYHIHQYQNRRPNDVWDNMAREIRERTDWPRGGGSFVPAVQDVNTAHKEYLVNLFTNLELTDERIKTELNLIHSSHEENWQTLWKELTDMMSKSPNRRLRWLATALSQLHIEDQSNAVKLMQLIQDYKQTFSSVKAPVASRVLPLHIV